MPQLRAVLLNTGLLLGSLIVGLSLLEAAMWIVHPPPSPYSLPRDLITKAGDVWTLSPDLHGVMDNRVDFRGAGVSTDARGVRHSTPPAAAGAARRLYVLGDSQSFGHGLDDEATWPSRLQVALDRTRPGIRVENWGVPGINIDQYAARLGYVLREAQADDAVLVGVTWNDLITPQNVRQVMQAVGGYLVTTPLADGDAPVTPAPTIHSATPPPNPDVAARIQLYEKTGLVIPPFQDLKQFADTLAANSALASFVVPRLYSLWHRWRTRTPLTDIVQARVPDANFLLLETMQRRVADRSVALTVILLPERHFVDDSLYAAYSGGGRFFPERNYMAYLAAPLCREFGLTYLDPFAALHEAHREAPVFFRVDGHYNARGASVIGDFVAGHLAEILR